MPFIQCDIRRGRTEEQRNNLCARVTEVVHRITGAPTSSILVLIREHAGDHWMEGGKSCPTMSPARTERISPVKPH